MGGWLIFAGDCSDLHQRLEKFKTLFSVPGVPSLRIEEELLHPGFAAVKWAWNEHEVPDVTTYSSDKSAALLCGVITDLGRYGTLPVHAQDGLKRILDLWERDGHSIVHELDGSFSLIIYDFKAAETNLFVDRFSSRAVWISRDETYTVAGNYPAAIAAVSARLPRVNPSGLWSLLHASRRPGAEGLISGQRKLLAGQQAVISRNAGVCVKEWWQRRYDPDYNLTKRTWGHEIAEALKESASRYSMVCESPYMFLSGGLDSRIAAAAYGPALKSLTLSNAPNLETACAGKAASAIGIEHHFIKRSPYWYLDTHAAAALVSSGDYFAYHSHYMVPVKETLSDDIEAEFMLGDLIENFSKHYYDARRARSIRFEPQNAMDILFSYAPYTTKSMHEMRGIFNKNIRDKMFEKYRADIEAFAERVMDVSDSDEDKVDTFLRWADVSVTPTYNMITCIRPLARERNLMFDNALNELSLRLPASLRGCGQLHSYILRALSWKAWIVPDANYFLPPGCPMFMKDFTKRMRPVLGSARRALARRKNDNPVLVTSGSWVLTHELYRKDKRYRERIEYLLDNEAIISSDIFDRTAVKDMWNEFLSGNIEHLFKIEALYSYASLIEVLGCGGLDI